MGAQSAQSKRDTTIRRILDAAVKIFADVGFGGARMDAIAQQDQINKAVTCYPIGDKKSCMPRHSTIYSVTSPIGL